MKFLTSITGLFIGAILDQWSGAIFGFTIGLLAGALIQHKNRIQNLERRIELLGSKPVESGRASEAAADPETVAEHEPLAAVNAPYEQAAAHAPIGSAAGTYAPPVAADWPDPVKRGVNKLKEYLTTGNLIGMAGAVILFFGIGLLLKYANDHNAISEEFYLCAAAVVGIAMQLLAWRLRPGRPDFALIVQGAAIGILYVTVFAAAKLHTVPLGFTFVVMLLVVVFSGYTAVSQDSKVLACLGIIGGFLAPILSSDDTSNHIGLFSYYAALNVGILGIAWHKSWRVLNWIGFIFTFVIASLWGYEAYEPRHFNTVEPFLILFFIFYVVIPILFAHRQPPKLKGLVDGSLVFGVPLIGFSLQSILVDDFEYGRAFSALGIAVVYLYLARLLWHRQVENMRMLAESFLALGVIFASLAIPFMLNGHWTAVTWALEGAGITWVGVRQRRLPARIFGILLQFGGGIVFLASDLPVQEMPLINSTYIGALFIAIGGLFIAYQYYRHRDNLPAAEQGFHIVPMTWGLAWWFSAKLEQIDTHLDPEYEINAALFCIALSLLLVSLVARRFQWRSFEHPPVLLLPAMTVIATGLYLDHPGLNPFLNLGYIAWISAFAAQYLLLYRCDGVWHKNLLGFWHSATMWLYTFMAAWIIADAIHDVVRADVWSRIIWGLIPAIAIYKLLLLRDRFPWPLRQYRSRYLSGGLLPMIIFLAIWIVAACFNAANPSPLNYWPILNPQDIVQLFAIGVIIIWLRRIEDNTIPPPLGLNVAAGFGTIAMIAFIWLTALVAHTVHYYAGVKYEAGPMFESAIFQTGISVVWTLTAFSIMGIASYLGKRYLWFIGGALLAAVSIKLFLIDIVDTDTVTRIVSFLTVGALMLAIAYLSPPTDRDHP